MQKRVIWLVEDEASIADTLIYALQTDGFEVEWFPLGQPLLARLEGMANSTASTGIPPEKVQVRSGTLEGQGPFGFSAALIPYFQAKGQPWLAQAQQRRTELALTKALGQADGERTEPLYYNVMLSLFALGWAENRFQFRDDGTLKLSWETSCVRTATH